MGNHGFPRECAEGARRVGDDWSEAFSAAAVVSCPTTDVAAPVADDLCDKLARAAAAPTEALRTAQLAAFVNQVDAKTGKGLTPAQAAELKLLAGKL